MNAMIAAIRTRAQALLLQPKLTWAVIASENHDAQRLLVGWVLPLAAVPAVARLLGGLLFARIPFGRLLSQVIGHYIMDVVAILAIGWFVAWLAPRFEGQNRFDRGLAWAAYAATPSMLAGALLLIPQLAVLQFVGSLYGLYIGYLGLSPMLRSRPDQSWLFLLALVAIGIVAIFALSPILGVLIR